MSNFALFRYLEMTERKRQQLGEQARDGDDVMLLAVPAELHRGMEGWTKSL